MKTRPVRQTHKTGRQAHTHTHTHSLSLSLSRALSLSQMCCLLNIFHLSRLLPSFCYINLNLHACVPSPRRPRAASSFSSPCGVVCCCGCRRGRKRATFSDGRCREVRAQPRLKHACICVPHVLHCLRRCGEAEPVQLRCSQHVLSPTCVLFLFLFCGERENVCVCVCVCVCLSVCLCVRVGVCLRKCHVK